MAALTGSDLMALAGLLGTIVGLPATLLILLLKGVRSDLASFRAATNATMAGFDERLRTVETEKVEKRDWIREQVSMAAKVDMVGREIASLNGKFDASLGIGAAISRTADSVRRLAETVSEATESKRA